MKQFAAQRAGADPATLLSFVPDRITAADEPLVRGILEELDRKPFDPEQAGARAETLVGGTVWLVRQTFGRHGNDVTYVRRAYQTAALLSLFVAFVHALFDFNFSIPSNPATLAAILGAAVASIDHDRRTRKYAHLERHM